MRFALVFELGVRAVVGYEYLVCLLEWCVKAVFTAHTALGLLQIKSALALLVGVFHVHYLRPHIFNGTIVEQGKLRLIVSLYLSP